MKKPAPKRKAPARAAKPAERLKRASDRLAEAEKKIAPFTKASEYPWISTHDKWGLGDATSIRNLRTSG
jgi:hypothetical protein